jgi:hypothetical protein
MATVITSFAGLFIEHPFASRKFFLHNWLVNMTDRADAFKENDLLQEHQNFWAKVCPKSIFEGTALECTCR